MAYGYIGEMLNAPVPAAVAAKYPLLTSEDVRLVEIFAGYPGAIPPVELMALTGPLQAVQLTTRGRQFYLYAFCRWQVLSAPAVEAAMAGWATYGDVVTTTFPLSLVGARATGLQVIEQYLEGLTRPCNFAHARQRVETATPAMVTFARRRISQRNAGKQNPMFTFDASEDYSPREIVLSL